MTTIPNEFTACEAYRGHIIAIRQGSYVIFTDEGERLRDPNGIPYRRDSRAQCRRSLDALLDEARVA